MSAADPIEMIQNLRPADPPAADAVTRLAARQYALAAQPPLNRRRAIVTAVAVLSLAVLTVVAVALAPWARTPSAAAAIDQLAKTAAAQPTAKIGPRDWIVVRYTSKRSWTQDLTQEKLDRLTARAVAVAEAAGGSGHFLRADSNGSSISKSVQARLDRMNKRRIDRIRAGVKLGDLPTTHVTAWNVSPYTSARNATGGGGGGGGSNEVFYDSPEQEAAGSILQRAGIGGRAADPTDFGGVEAEEQPLRAVGDQRDVERLPDDPAELRAALTGWKVVSGVEGRAGSAQDLLMKASGVVASPYATSGQRAAAIRMISMLPGVQFERETQDARGRSGVGLALPIPGGTIELVFDTNTSQLLGMVVSVKDPKEFVGDSYAGSGKDRVPVIPPFDSATLAVSYDPWTISRDGPPCTPQMCMRGAGEMPPPPADGNGERRPSR